MTNPVKSLWRDVKFGWRLFGILRLLADLKPDEPNTITKDIEATVEKFPDKCAFVFEGKETTYRQFDERANRVAHWAREQGFQAGDVVALNLENCPDYGAIWFGLSKVGVATALINTNLESDGLAHCIKIVDAKAVIAGGEQAVRVAACLGIGDDALPIWDLYGKVGSDFGHALAAQKSTRPDPETLPVMLGKDIALFIYTSGTTGLPKAARMTHMRIRAAAKTPQALIKIKPSDRVYTALPLYHTTGGSLGMVASLCVGATVILRRKFSASQFWDDVTDNDASLFVYIGELCRYLLSAPDHPKQTAHKLRGGYGNGLRGEVWRPFVERFQVPSMRELYGSTEGNVTFLNLDGKIGAIGQMPPWMGAKMGIELVKFDVVEEEPIRGADGFCISADVDEPGEAIGKITDVGRQDFTGYNDPKATEKKILTDVFEKGDRWFRTGDLISRDQDHYLYFIDRIGDTFRWKGENVATNEVSDAMSKYPGIELANVYGVEVPGADGRAGMAAITVSDSFKMDGLAAFLAGQLPSYAVPLFLRIQSEADTTGTFKFRKVELVKEGFDLSQVEDPIWFLEPGNREFVALNEDRLSRLRKSEYRF